MRTIIGGAALAILVAVALLLHPGCGDGEASDAPAPKPPFSFVNPLIEAKPGDSAVYRESDGKTMHIEVLQNKKNAVTIRQIYRDPETERMLDNQVIDLHPNHFWRGYDAAGWVIVKMYEDRIEHLGREWDCLVIEYVTKGHGPVTAWYSTEVPGIGLLRQVKTGLKREVVNAELESWSRGK
jgi:hypothetical protein